MKREFKKWNAFELLQPEFEGKPRKIELLGFFPHDLVFILHRLVIWLRTVTLPEHVSNLDCSVCHNMLQQEDVNTAIEVREGELNRGYEVTLFIYVPDHSNLNTLFFTFSSTNDTSY